MSRLRRYRREAASVISGLGQQPVPERRYLGQRRSRPGGPRTSLFAPELDRLFVAARAGFFGLGSDAAILVLCPQP